MKPQLIIKLEKELNCSFKSVKISEIDEYKGEKTFEYSVDDTGNITGISIIRNDLKEIPKTISENATHLNFLTSLNLSSNKISDISSLKELANIQFLYLMINKISDICPLKDLKKIQVLWLNSNQIINIAFLKDLKNIQKLWLFANEISDISQLKELKKLQNLSLGSNPIKILPEWICDFPKMNIQWNNEWKNNFISFSDNPIENVPIEIIKQGKAAIKAWFAANKKKLNEIKVLLVGDAEAGKTSICKRLKDNTFDKQEKQTDGIKIEKLVFADLPTFAQQTRLHGLSAYVWDFGGQEIMTSTHRFFLTNRSIYILVLEARNDKSTETQIRKWLENITTQGGNSPVIIAVNKIDVNPAFDIDLYNLRKEFPQIAGYVRISCEKDENLHQLKQLLETAIPQAELFNTEIDERWLRIKDELQETTGRNHKINESDYTALCNRHELTSPAGQTQCVRFLHDLGIILHFDTLDLGEYYILDPLWVTTGVYRIITSEKAANASGVVPYENLREIANTTKNETETGEYSKITYSNFESRYLADIMEEFKLCFFASQKKLMLIPDLFKKETPATEVERIIHSAEKLELIYDYPFLHHSVISRLIVAINGEIQHFWRSGVITASKSLNSTCLVRCLNDQIQITVTGDKKDKRQYLSQIRYFVNQINEEFKLKPTLLIPLSENSFIEYEVLVEMEREGEKTYRDYKLKKTYQISQLLEGIESNEEIQRQSATIVNNYNSINVTGMNNKVIQDAVKSTISLTDNTIPMIENISDIQNLELLIDKKVFLEKELILSYDGEKKFALQAQIKELGNWILGLKK
jgi:internalin A